MSVKSNYMPVTVEDLIAKAVEAGEVVTGVNDPETLQKIAAGERDILEGRVHSEAEVDSMITRWATEK